MSIWIQKAITFGISSCPIISKEFFFMFAAVILDACYTL